jgi:hypothetical protein
MGKKGIKSVGVVNSEKKGGQWKAGEVWRTISHD